MSEFRFEEPPPAKRQPKGYEEIAQRLRENPGKWARVASFPERTNAGTLAQVVIKGRTRAWHNPGDFEAVSRAVDGKFLVYARYLGDGGRSDERP